MGREKINPEAPELKKYLKELYQTLDTKRGARKTGVTNDYFVKIINNEVLPEYNLLEEVIVYAGGNMEKVRKIAHKNPQLAYKYWENLFPEAQPINKLGLIISEIIEDKDANRRDLRKELDLAQSYLSNIENCKITVSYQMLCKFADYFKMEPLDILYKLLSASNYEENRKKFRDIICTAREIRGWDIEKASARLKINPNKLLKIEQGLSKITQINLFNFVSTYELDYNEVLLLCYNGRILNKLLPDINDYFVSTKAGGVRKNSESSLEDYLYNLCKYKYISVNSGKAKVKIESHTAISLLFLVLTNKGSVGRYENQIYYYLNNIFEKGNIAEKLITEFCDEINKIGIGKFFDKCRKAHRYTYQELEIYSGYSRSYITNRISSGNFNNIETCDKLFPLVGIPVCVGYESVCSDRGTKALGNEKASEISIDEILDGMKTSLIWTFWREVIPQEVIRTFFDIIVDEEESCFAKYEKILKLQIPEKYNKYKV